MRAIQTISGNAALEHVHPLLVELVARLDALAIVQGGEYAIGDGPRSEADQEEHYREGRSSAHYGESPHNFSPAWGIDVFPIVAGSVSTNLADYADIEQVANELNLVWLGPGDAAHVQVAGWQNLEPDYGRPDDSFSPAALAGIIIGGFLIGRALA